MTLIKETKTNAKAQKMVINLGNNKQHSTASLGDRQHENVVNEIDHNITHQ